MAGHAEDVQVAVADLEGEQDVEPLQRYSAVDVEEVHSQLVAAWVRRKWRQLVSVDRDGAGGIRWRRRIRRIVEAPIVLQRYLPAPSPSSVSCWASGTHTFGQLSRTGPRHAAGCSGLWPCVVQCRFRLVDRPPMRLSVVPAGRPP